MSDRLPLPGPMPAELAERLSDVDMAKITETEEAAAVRDIIEDYLLLGWTYPRRGQRVADAGAFLRSRLDEDATDRLLRLLLYGCGQELGDEQSRIEKLCREELPAWLLKNFPDLVQARAEEIRDERSED